MAQVQQLVKALKESVEKDQLDAAKTTLAQLKLQMIQDPLLPPLQLENPQVKARALLFREIYELAVFLSIRSKDMAGFERHIAFLRVFYYDYDQYLVPSPRRWEIIGLQLLGLLANHKIAAFHTELELVPVKNLSDPFIAFAVNVEQELMEGSYSQIWNATRQLPSPYYRFFMDSLVETVRQTILNCCRIAYSSLSVKDAMTLLNLDTIEEAEAFCSNNGCSCKNGAVNFNIETKDNLKIPAEIVSGQVLSYAAELERIV